MKLATKTNKPASIALPGNIKLRKDGFIPLSWFDDLNFMATLANGGSGWDTILTGPASSGKTTGAYALAHDLNYEIIVQQCHKRVEVEDFRGTRSIIQGKGNVPITGFDPGTFTMAVEHAIRYEEQHKVGQGYKGVVYLIDEINLVDPSMLAILNNMTQRDKHSCLVIPETGARYPRPSNLIIIGTMNPEYIGTNQLSEATISRIVKLECPMMRPDEIRAILHLKFPNHILHADIAARVMQFIESGRRNEQFQWEPDLRTIIQFLDLWVHRDTSWKRGRPFDIMADCLDKIIGPKIGWRDTFTAQRKGLCDAIRSGLGDRMAAGDDVNAASLSLDD